jgi:hypothetical protein
MLEFSKYQYMEGYLHASLPKYPYYCNNAWVLQQHFQHYNYPCQPRSIPISNKKDHQLQGPPGPGAAPAGAHVHACLHPRTDDFTTQGLNILPPKDFRFYHPRVKILPPKDLKFYHPRSHDLTSKSLMILPPQDSKFYHPRTHELSRWKLTNPKVKILCITNPEVKILCIAGVSTIKVKIVRRWKYFAGENSLGDMLPQVTTSYHPNCR